MGLDFRIEGQVGVFTIDNPSRRNALDGPTLALFQSALQHFDSDPGIKAGIITGSGDQAFCSGIDLKETLVPDNSGALPPTLMRGIQTNKPLIAAVNGAALGGGLELVLACDIRIAASTALFGFPEVKLGLIPGWGGTQRLVRQIPWPAACALLFTGRSIDSQEALRIGLVNQVVNSPELGPVARQWAGLICQAAPLAVQAAKEAMLKGLQLTFDEALQLEDAFCAYLKTTADFQEGWQAFRDHRSPDFKGR